MSDEDSKFSFSERTRVDEGDAARSPDDATPHDEALPVVEGTDGQDAVEWFYERGEGQEGPTTSEGLRAMLAAGDLKTGHRIWRDGLVAWAKASEFEHLLAEDGSPSPSEEEVANDTLENDDDTAGKTGVVSSNELKEAGILGSETPQDLPEVMDQESDSQTYVARTMMLDPSKSDDATVAQVQAIDHVEEDESDATVADMTSLGPDVGDGTEATVALVDAIPEEPAPVVYQLVLMGGSKGTETYEVHEPHRVAGRHADCDLVIQDSSVSRRHFELTRTPDGYRLNDLGSGNGTLVDGEAVSQVLLKHGMTIEAGVTRLQWIDPRVSKPVQAESESEKTQMIDIAQLQNDPSFKPDRRPASQPEPERRPSSQSEPKRPAPQSADRPRTDNVRRPNRENSRTARQTRPEIGQALQWGALAALGLLALVGALSLLGLLPTDDEEIGEAERSVVISNSGAAVLMSEGLEAFKAWRWSDARRLFEAARDQATDKTSAKDALSRVAQEELASTAMEAVRTSLESNRYREAIKKLVEVPDTSVYFGDAQALINDAKEGLVSGHLKEARKLSEVNMKAEAIEKLERALKILPGDAEVVALMREYQDAAAKPEKRSRKAATGSRRETRRGKSTASRRAAPKRRSKSGFDLEPDWPEDEPVAQAKPAPLDVAPALVKYSAGKFSDARRMLERVTRNSVSERQRSQAKRLISDISAFQNLWETGKDEASAENLSAAISSLKRAKVLDKAISGAYKRRIDLLLANQYATQANQSMLAGKHARAGSLARKALALASGQSVARAVMEEVRKRADQWLSSAESQLSSNPDRAKTLLTQVLTVFPKRDPRYTRAYGMLKLIDVEDDD